MLPIRLTIVAIALLTVACQDDVLYRAPVRERLDPPPTAVVDNEPVEQPVQQEEPIEEPVEEPIDEPEPLPADDCEGVEDAIYVIDKEDGAIFTYDPTTSSFDLVGELNCGAFAGQPASMSVARNGLAYVRFADDSLYEVNLETMDCRETAYESRFGHFGMGFAAAERAGRDQLFVANRRHLARLDLNSWRIETLGELPSQSELSGNQNGELWAVLPLESPARLARLDPNTARVQRSIALHGFPEPRGIDTFAFATWGGEFYIFVRQNGMGNSTTVYRVRANGQLEVHDEDTGMNVVGAGVSTCASAG